MTDWMTGAMSYQTVFGSPEFGYGSPFWKNNLRSGGPRTVFHNSPYIVLLMCRKRLMNWSYTRTMHLGLMSLMRPTICEFSGLVRFMNGVLLSVTKSNLASLA